MEIALQPREIQKVVNATLTGALVRGQDIGRISSEQLAQDILDTREELAGESVKTITAHVRNWWNQL